MCDCMSIMNPAIHSIDKEMCVMPSSSGSARVMLNLHDTAPPYDHATEFERPQMTISKGLEYKLGLSRVVSAAMANRSFSFMLTR